VRVWLVRLGTVRLRVIGVGRIAHAVGVIVRNGGTTFGQVAEDIGSSRILVISQTDVVFLESLGETN
jgi:hypothetical protein